MDNGTVTSPNRCEGASDQILAGLRQNLDGDVLWNAIFVNETADKIEISAGSRGETHLDFFKSHGPKRIKESSATPRAHLLDERLIAVAKIDAAPDRGPSDCCAGPAPIG